MIYIFEESAGEEQITIKGELYKYLIKVRRHNVGDEVAFRTKKESTNLHLYKLTALEPRSAILTLVSSQTLVVESSKELHIAWCVVDSKSVEKVLPSLCELGVAKISFIFCERSQKNFKPDFKRYERIVEASMQQSGRTSFIQFDTYNNIDAFIKKFPDTIVLDFTDKIFEYGDGFSRVLIGCEGGFSKEEKELLKTQAVFRLNSPMVLRSESAVLAVSSLIML